MISEMKDKKCATPSRAVQVIPEPPLEKSHRYRIVVSNKSLIEIRQYKQYLVSSYFHLHVHG